VALRFVVRSSSEIPSVSGYRSGKEAGAGVPLLARCSASRPGARALHSFCRAPRAFRRREITWSRKSHHAL